MTVNSMLFISCRQNFWKDSKLSTELQWAEVGRDGATRLLTPEEIEARLDKMKDKRILLMIHGFNDMEKPVVHHFFGVADFTQKYVVDTSGQCYFEEVIGFAWPGYSHFFDYFLAEENALASAPFLQELLMILSVNVKQLDVFAHSMGNRVFLEALDFPRGPGDPIIHTYFAAGPAVDEKSIYNDKAFFQSISHIREIVVLYSLKDPIEKWFYPIAERATALGAEGVWSHWTSLKMCSWSIARSSSITIMLILIKSISITGYGRENQGRFKVLMQFKISRFRLMGKLSSLGGAKAKKQGSAL